MSLQDVVSVRVVASIPVGPRGIGALGTWFPTADGFGVRFPDGDHFVRLEPPRRWKRGQKLNRGGRRRARATHAESMKAAQERWVQSQIDAAYVGLCVYGPVSEAVADYKSWAAKTGEEILEDLRDFAAKFTSEHSQKGGGR